MAETTHARFSGKNLRAARKAAGMSRQKLAQAIDFEVGPHTIYLYERDHHVPLLNTAIGLAKALQISLKDLTDAKG